MDIAKVASLARAILAECDADPTPVPTPTPTPTPPPPPVGPTNYVVDPGTWSFVGNYRLPIVGVRSGVPVTIAFTTPATVGAKANINIQADSGYNGTHIMTIDGRTITSQTPTFYLVVGPTQFTTSPYVRPPQIVLQGLQPSTTYVATILTNQGDRFGDFHVNFQGAGN